MRRIHVQFLKPDMVVARPIFNSDGRILLQTGVILNDNYINRLQEISIGSIYIIDELTANIDIKDIVSEETRVKTIVAVKESFSKIENQHKLNIRLVQNLVDKIIDELLWNSDVLINLTDIRAFDDYTFAHSVNVCILSILTGISLGYNDLKLKPLGIGALLHDIGKTQISKELLNKPDDLSPDEFNEVKKHSEYGFEILRQYPDVSLLAAHIALQHHERWDGNGYPRKLNGDNIHEYARIVAVSDVYDALLADRPYRPAYTINQSITIIKRMSGIYLDEKCVSALVSNIAIFPMGSIIQLNTGDIGIVVDVNKNTPTRPVIKIIYDGNLRKLTTPHEIDLSKMSTVMIFKQLLPSEIENLK